MAKIIIQKPFAKPLSKQPLSEIVRHARQFVTKRFSGNFRLYAEMIDAGLEGKVAASVSLGPHKKQDETEVVRQPENAFGDYWDSWQSSPDRMNEERENHL